MSAICPSAGQGSVAGLAASLGAADPAEGVAWEPL
jgi:hypothetical protein